MTDGIRGRIAAALVKAEIDWLEGSLYDAMADAVIHELQLTVLGDGIVVGVIHE